jgi:hypothetical protein
MLKSIPKPTGTLTPSDDLAIEVRGHMIRGYYDEQENYYEHDETTDRWFRLVT